MRFEWDETKNQFNIRKHGLDFADAYEIFAGTMFTIFDDRTDYGEDRWIGIGRIHRRIVDTALKKDSNVRPRVRC